jgi:3-hydroxymyristoyl/3-hydroxydecanoyl-(acyl carrier protein) dehydratase
MDIHKIMAVLPHRPPFLLIDRIIEMSESHVVEAAHEKKAQRHRQLSSR